MSAIIGAGVFSIVIVISLLILCGLPFGELTMGGKYPVFPKKLRMILAIQLTLQIFFVVILLQTGNFLPRWFSENTTKRICIGMAVYLTWNTVMNLLSKSKKEKYIMTPLSAISALCFWLTAW